MRGHDLPVVDYTWFRRSDWTDAPDAVLAEVAAHIGPRSVVKPARLGSSLGMSVVHDQQELPAAIAEALRYDSKVLVEAYVADARELEVGVIGNDDPQAFEPGEVRSHGEWYDYAAKYTEGLADVIPRADVDPQLAARLRELALAAYRAVDCAGFARVDFLVPRDGVYLSEMNTIPGFTATSMFPKQAEMAGIGFGRLVDRLLHLALEREGPNDPNGVGEEEGER
jgi:D-alanine-D-alanine ligase